MDGVAIILALLGEDPGIAALQIEGGIQAGTLPRGTPLDAIAVNSVSATDRNILAPGETRRVTERVQVSAVAKSYPRMKEILRAVKAAAADFVGTVAGVTEVTVHTESTGPDVMDEQASIHIGSQDFMVGFSQAR